MRTRDIETAKQFGILERCKAFEADLLKIKDIVPDKFDDGIPFNLKGFLSSIYQVIIVPQYNIRWIGPITGRRGGWCSRMWPL